MCLMFGGGEERLKTFEKMWAVFPYHVTLNPFPSNGIPWEYILIHESNIVP